MTQILATSWETQMHLKVSGFLALLLCLTIVAPHAAANDAEYRKCNSLYSAQTAACTAAEGQCKAIKHCNSILSYLKQEQCLDARRTKSGCTNTLNECLERGAKEIRSKFDLSDYANAEKLFEETRLKRCATYKWKRESCVISADYTANHCPGTIISDTFLNTFKTFEDPRFECRNNVEAAKYVSDLCKARRQEFNSANCDRVPSFEGIKLEKFVCNQLQ